MYVIRYLILALCLACWALYGQSGPTPGGAAGGDLCHNYPSPIVCQVENAVIPTSAVVLGTNGSMQLVAATTTGSGTVVLATGPTITLSNATLLPCGALPALTGDTTTSATSCATTTGKINGTTFPTSAAVIGSNGSAQPISQSTTGSLGNVVLSNTPTITTPSIAAINGGTATGSTLSLSGTSNGSPSASYVFLQKNAQFTSVFSSVTPDAALFINANTNTSPVAPVTALLHLIQADGVSNFINIDAFGTGKAPGIIFRLANGTAASPTAIIANSFLGEFVGQGYDTTGYFNGGALIYNGTQTWTSTAHGASIVFYTVPNGTTTLTPHMTVDNDGQIYAPNLVSVSTGVTGSVCWTTSTGRLTVDTTATCLTSSARFKNTIAAYQVSALTLINQLVPVTFHYNANLGMPTTEHIGLIAEDVNKIIPDVVYSDSSGPEKLNIQDLVAVLVKAIQEQQIEIRALQVALGSVSGILPNPVVTYTPPVVTPFVPLTYNPNFILPNGN